MRRCCTASTSAAAFRPPRPTLPLIASGGRIAADRSADGLFVTLGRSGARRLARRRTQPLSESRRVVFPVPGFAAIGKPPVRLAAEKHPLVHGRRIHPDQIPERPCRGLGEAQATVGHVQIDGQAQRVRGERCDGKTIVGARGVRLRNGWRAIRVVDGERDTFSTRRRPHLHVRGRCVAVKTHALFARHGNQRASHPALHRGVELAGANRSGLALVRTTLRAQACERREHPVGAILVRPRGSARKIGGVPGEAEIAIAFGRLEALQRRALLVENEQTLVGGKVFGWLPTVDTHALAFHGGPQLFRARSSNTSTRSSTSSGTFAPAALTASFQAPGGPETSAAARSVRDRGHGGAQPAIGVPEPLGGSSRSFERVGAGLAAGVREDRDPLDAQIEPAVPAREAIRVERERHLDLLAGGGLLQPLPRPRARRA